MKLSSYKWFEITVRYYDPKNAEVVINEKIALEAENFSDAEQRVNDLYDTFLPFKIQSITPVVYEDVIFSHSRDDEYWYLVELQKDIEMVNDYYQYLSDSGCTCPYMEFCSRPNKTCNKECSNYIKDSDNRQYKDCNSLDQSQQYMYREYMYHVYNGYPYYALNGNLREIDIINPPECFREVGAMANKTLLLVQAPDFVHALKKANEYIYDSFMDYNIIAITQTQLIDVIPLDQCQL